MSTTRRDEMKALLGIALALVAVTIGMAIFTDVAIYWPIGVGVGLGAVLATAIRLWWGR